MYDFLFDNLNRQFKAINETISAPYVQLFEQISVYSKTTEQINALSKQLISAYEPLIKMLPNKISQDWQNIFQYYASNYNAVFYQSAFDSLTRISRQFQASFNDEFINSLKHIYENLPADTAPGNLTQDMNDASDDTNCISEDAFVDLPLETVNKIEEKIVEIPQDVCIKRGNITIRIKSEFIFNIINILVAIIFGILACIQNLPKNSETTATIMQSLEQTIGLLSEIAYNSSGSDANTTNVLQDLQESVETGNELLQEVLQFLDSNEENPDNNFASDDIQQDTELTKNYKQSL